MHPLLKNKKDKGIEHYQITVNFINLKSLKPDVVDHQYQNYELS